VQAPSLLVPRILCCLTAVSTTNEGGIEVCSGIASSTQSDNAIVGGSSIEMEIEILETGMIMDSMRYLTLISLIVSNHYLLHLQWLPDQIGLRCEGEAARPTKRTMEEYEVEMKKYGRRQSMG
jgi:hypothetical protein